MAWSVAIGVVVLMAAQQMPVRWRSGLDMLALTTFGLGLAYLVLMAWLCADRGFRLRRPVNPEVFPSRWEFSTYAGLALLTGVCWWRGAESRLLACGLDRLAAALFIVSMGSAVLWLISRRLRRGLPAAANEAAAGNWLAWSVWILGTGVTLSLAALELMQW